MRILYGLIGLFYFLSVLPVCGENTVTVKNKGVVIDEGAVQIIITCLDKHIVHIQACPKSVPEVRESLVVDDSCFRFDDFRVSRNKTKVLVKTSRLTVEYDKVLKRIAFIDRGTGEVILAENSRDIVAGQEAGENIHRVIQRFALDPKEAVYGLGQYQDGVFNYRGKVVK